jgi:hypothetical protein
MIKLIVNVEHNNGLRWFAVEVDGETVYFRHGLREKEEAQRIVDLWIRKILSLRPKMGVRRTEDTMANERFYNRVLGVGCIVICSCSL